MKPVKTTHLDMDGQEATLVKHLSTLAPLAAPLLHWVDHLVRLLQGRGCFEAAEG